MVSLCSFYSNVTDNAAIRYLVISIKSSIFNL